MGEIISGVASISISWVMLEGGEQGLDILDLICIFPVIDLFTGWPMSAGTLAF
jgi:hypothetical protein